MLALHPLIAALILGQSMGPGKWKKLLARPIGRPQRKDQGVAGNSTVDTITVNTVNTKLRQIIARYYICCDILVPTEPV